MLCSPQALRTHQTSRWTGGGFVHTHEMTAGAAAIVARRAEREAQAQRKQVEAEAAFEQASEQRTAPTRPTVHMDTNVAASTMVPGEARRATQLKDKKAWRRSSTIKALMPKGSGAIYTFPRREEERFGEEGDEGDALFEAAMAKFKAEDFGEQHVQLRVIKQKFGQVRRSQWSCVRVVRW